MLSQSYTGLATLNWFQRASAKNNLDFKGLTRYAFSKKTETFFTDVQRFYKKQYEIGKKSRTWLFSRLFDDEYLSEWAVSNYPYETATYTFGTAR